MAKSISCVSKRMTLNIKCFERSQSLKFSCPLAANSLIYFAHNLHIKVNVIIPTASHLTWLFVRFVNRRRKKTGKETAINSVVHDSQESTYFKTSPLRICMRYTHFKKSKKPSKWGRFYADRKLKHFLNYLYSSSLTAGSNHFYWTVNPSTHIELFKNHFNVFYVNWIYETSLSPHLYTLKKRQKKIVAIYLCS